MSTSRGTNVQTENREFLKSGCCSTFGSKIHTSTETETIFKTSEFNCVFIFLDSELQPNEVHFFVSLLFLHCLTGICVENR